MTDLAHDAAELNVAVTLPAAGHAEVTITGRLDAVAAPDLRATLDSIAHRGPQHLLIDLSAVSFVDSAGLAVLVRARRESRLRGGDVVIVSPTLPDAMRVFRLTQFDHVFRMVSPRSSTEG